MGLFKKAKKATKKAASTVAKETKEAAKETEKAIKSSIDKIEDFNLSKEMNKLARDAEKKLKDLGDDFEGAIKDLGMQKILKDLAKQVVKDNKKVIDTMVKVGKRIEKIPNMRAIVQDMVAKQEKGKLDYQEVQDLKKKVGLDGFFE